VASKNSQPSRYSFIGVFIVGVTLLVITVKYYARNEPGDEREARDRRISAELIRFKK
jgi:hypothetical protein